MDEDANADIYENLPDFRFDTTLDQLNASIAKLEAENCVLQSRLVRVIEEKKVLEANCSVLNTNISSLLKTAKLEIKRKERTIVELREQLNKVMPRKKQFGLKRRRETIATPSPRKKPRFSPRKSREDRPQRYEDRYRSRKEDTRSNLKSEAIRVSNLEVSAVQGESPTNVEKERRPGGRSPSRKEKAPLKDTGVVKERSNGNSTALTEISVAPSPTTAAPALPALECPTLFSCRMYKRLYGRDIVPTSAVDSTQPRETILPAAVSQPPKNKSLLKSEQPPSHNKGSSSQQPSSHYINRVTPEDVRMFIRMNEDSYNTSDSSSSSISSLMQFQHNPVATSYIKPQNCNGAASLKVTRTDLKPKPLENVELPPKKLEVRNNQQTSVEPPPKQSMSPEKTKIISSKVNVEQPSAKSRVARGGLLAVGKTRQQMVVAIRPIQTLAAQETPTGVDKSDKNCLVLHEPNSSIENSPESKLTEDKSVCSVEKSSRLLKIPGLSGSARGRTLRQVFAPISNQWNYIQPTDGNRNGGDKKDEREFSVVKPVSVTSELTVRVDDLKQDEFKRQLLFGSPVKWADDSSDSPVPERPTNSRKMYTIFGSPCIDRSNSSEHPFSVPPGAYEDSCWTHQISEKVPTKFPAGEADVQKSSERSPEPVPFTETKPKEKKLELNDAEKVSAASSTCPPPSLSAIKKHVSIFSPVKDSKHSVTNKMPDEPSRSNTGICFPFTRPRYEDSVLGQFDDTAQFVSALAKVDSKISPLSTPIKSGDGSEHTQSIIVEKNPTSFQQVFKKNVPDVDQQSHEIPHSVNGTDAVISEGHSNVKGQTAGTTHQSALSKHAKEYHETENGNIAIGSAENPRLQKTSCPPTITVTPPKTESSLRLIHRPNFASSTILSVKSWFPNAPVKMVTPRKTPRLVSSVSRSASPKGLEVSAGARITINDAFIIEQEERVRRWELDHLYENTIRSGSGSPLKSVNGSPTRKRIDSPGKASSSKRSPKKQVSPCKRRVELHKNVGVEHLQYPSDADTSFSRVAVNKESPVDQTAPHSANSTEVVRLSVDDISSPTPMEPIKSLSDPTQKLLTMLNGIMINSKRTEPGSSSLEANTLESKAALSSVDLPCVSAKMQADDKAVDHINPSDCFCPEPPKSTLGHEIVPLQSTLSDDKKSSTNELCRENSTNDQKLTVKHPDSSVLSQTPPPCTQPVLLNNECRLLPTEATVGLKEDISRSSRVVSVDASTFPLGSSSVASTEASQSSDSVEPPAEVETIKNRKQRKSFKNINFTASDVPTDPSKRPESIECHANTLSSECAKMNGGHNGKQGPRCSKYASIISRVKPSAQLNKSVAALITSSLNPASSPSPRPRLTISTPIMQSTKKSNFKRSSALKPSTQEGAGNSLMNSIRSTFFQGTPTSSMKTDNSCAQITPKHSIQPRRIHAKRSPNLSVNSTNEVIVHNPVHTPVVPSSLKKNVELPSTAELRSKASVEAVALHDAHSTDPAGAALSRRPSEKKCSTPGLWKLIEVDHSSKPISLLQRFKGPQGNDGSERIYPAQPETPLPKSGVKVNQDSAKHPPKSPLFPRSSLRKTILLESPMKMSNPVKGKRRNAESVESCKSDEKRVDPESGGMSRMRTASSGRITSETSLKICSDEYAEPERSSRKSRYTDSRRSSQKRSASACDESSRKSRDTKCDESLTPRHRRKSHSAHHSSPEQSPTRESREMKSYGKDKYHNKDEEPESKFSKSSDRRSSKYSSKSSDKPSKTQSGQSKISFSESKGRRPKTTSSNAGCRSVMSSCESTDSNSKMICKESSNENHVVQSPDQVLHPKTTPVKDVAEPRTSIPPFSENVGVPTLKIEIPSNRRTNFSVTSSTEPTKIVVSMGKRPALFSPI